MKLFLASSADKTLQLLGKQVPDIGKKVLFVANAADPYADRFWVDWDRNKFKELGYQLHELDLRETTPEKLKRFLQSNDILHICGGSVYYLVSLIRERHFDNIITQAIRDEAVVYTGTSAGSIIVSDNIRAFSYDEEEREYIKKVPDHKGLGILNFAIMPHCNNPDFVSEHKKVVEKMAGDPTAIFYIQDHQVIWVKDGYVELLEAK
jgi:peptidase E